MYSSPSPKNEAQTGNKTFIAIAGNIGAGKTTLTRMLCERLGWQSHFEAVTDNPYLEDFYANMERWSFPLQIFFLNNRFRAHQTISQGGISAIQDRSIYEDAHIFARNLHSEGKLSKRDYHNYLDLYHHMTSYLESPDLILYIRKSVPKLVDRIRQRGRAYEANLPVDYLSNLNQFYDEWMEGYSDGPKLILDTDDLDFVENPSDFDNLVTSILGALDQRDLFYHAPLTQRQTEDSKKSLYLG